MSTELTIPEITTEANDLYTALTADMTAFTPLPELDLPTDFEIPVDDGTMPAIAALTVDQLTVKTVDGTGVFDVLMTALNTHINLQAEKGRLVGADYAKVYLGMVQGAMSTGMQFLLSKDQATLQAMQAKEAVLLTQAQRIKAQADIQIARAQIQQMALATAKMQYEAGAARNAYAQSKMDLVTAYHQANAAEAQAKLVGQQYESERANTLDTHEDGTPITGMLGQQKALLEAQALTANEQLDTARAQTKDTLLDGSPVGGLVAIDKAFKEAQQVQMSNQGQLTLEQVETQRAQTRDTLSTGEVVAGLMGVDKQIKLSQLDFTAEQADTQRAQTKDTLKNGLAVAGVLAKEKALKDNQSKLVSEQYETQRAQTRGKLSDNSTVAGVLGAQVALYNQQVTSYQRDAESKALKIVLDTWTARKTIDEGVAVPANIDTPVIDTMMASYKTKLGL